MSKIMAAVIGVTFDGEVRIKRILDRNIPSGTLKETAEYKASTFETALSKRKRRGVKEAKEAEVLMEEIGAKENAGSLKQVIQRRQVARSSIQTHFWTL
ncbi:hypothetical protein KIN20_019492 [Parelaphostrongylus tenuis]|uniref:Uncharacterized protein n=1 Tax=Parelaphostrongylus tenuis TaxID=148309 RepID=A0AAD5N298_PARTN|nr:hypothetical protein KIN20_019492 [Parelaphostrongylus tenuis]